MAGSNPRDFRIAGYTSVESVQPRATLFRTYPRRSAAPMRSCRRRRIIGLVACFWRSDVIGKLCSGEIVGGARTKGGPFKVGIVPLDNLVNNSSL